MTQAATTSGALKAVIESAGLGLSAYRDRAPEGATLPYVTILEEVGLYADEDGGKADDDSLTGVESVQVDLWQQYRDPVTKAITEDYTLAKRLRVALDGSQLPKHPEVVYAAEFIRTRRLLEHENNIVHHPLLFNVARGL